MPNPFRPAAGRRTPKLLAAGLALALALAAGPVAAADKVDPEADRILRVE
jgi:hypothetical protein